MSKNHVVASTVPKRPWKFADWYAANATEFNEKRRERYVNDPTYRARVRDTNQKVREKAKERRKIEHQAEVAAIRVKPPSRSLGAPLQVRVGGQDVTTMVYTLGALARALGCAKVTLYKWEREGVLPETSLRNARGARIYTADQVLDIRKSLEASGKLEEVRKRKAGIRAIRMYRVATASGEGLHTLHRLGTLAKLVQRSRETLHQWENYDLLPPTPLRSGGKTGHRLYTVEMMMAVKNAIDACGGEIVGDSTRKTFHDTVQSAWRDSAVFDMRVVPRTKQRRVAPSVSAAM